MFLKFYLRKFNLKIFLSPFKFLKLFFSIQKNFLFPQQEKEKIGSFSRSNSINKCGKPICGPLKAHRLKQESLQQSKTEYKA